MTKPIPTAVILTLPHDLHAWLERVSDHSGIPIETCAIVHLVAERIRAQDREYEADAAYLMGLSVDEPTQDSCVDPERLPAHVSTANDAAREAFLAELEVSHA